MRHNRLYIFVGILILALTGLLSLLIHWGNKSIELREALFVDRTNVAVNQLITELEDNYYCFDLRSEMSLPKLDSFYIDHFPGLDLPQGEKLPLKYQPPGGEEQSFHKMPLMGPAHVQIMLRFEFDAIPEFRSDSSLTDFERFVKDSYDQYIVSPDGIRLIDTTQFDSLLTIRVKELYPEAILHYTIDLAENNETIHETDQSGLFNALQADIKANMFDKDALIPDLILSLEVVNKNDLFADQAWNIYASAGALALISIFLIFYLVKLQLQQKKLLRIQKDFVHGMTHEFNTPIANMNLVAKSLLKSDDEKTRKAGQIVDEEGKKLQNGINLVLTTALIEKDELMLQKDQLEARQIIEKLAERNSYLLKEHGISLHLNIREDVLELHGDAFHLENVFQNMINNVVKHSNADTLNIEAQRNNGHIVIKFVDNGKGIAQEDRDLIFEKFERRSAQSKNGYGLGLYYSKMILDLHGGRIYLDESGIQGSSFSIQLPV